MDFFATHRFKDDYEHLIKKPKDGYSSLPKDLTDFFLEFQSIEDLWKHKVMIYESEGKRLLKSRIPNSGQNWVEKNGFRLIFTPNREEDKVGLVTVYPKRGKYAANTLKKDASKMLLNEYISERDSNKLFSIIFSQTELIFKPVSEIVLKMPVNLDQSLSEEGSELIQSNDKVIQTPVDSGKPNELGDKIDGNVN